MTVAKRIRYSSPALVNTRHHGDKAELDLDAANTISKKIRHGIMRID
jgi:hypothetical protein